MFCSECHRAVQVCECSQVAGLTQFQPVEFRQPQSTIEVVGRALWRELFTQIDTEEQLRDWEGRIPRYECDCETFYRNWKMANPPTFPIRFDWKWELKTAVNAKLGRDNLSIDEARSFWDSID